jgi:hypothetical protein
MGTWEVFPVFLWGAFSFVIGIDLAILRDRVRKKGPDHFCP